jgi:hypothetical protein
VAQAAVLLGSTKDAVRAACDRRELAHTRDHLNAYRIPCSALASVVARSRMQNGQRSRSDIGPQLEKSRKPQAVPPKR